MRYTTLLAACFTLLSLAGCATQQWTPRALEAKQITIHFVGIDEWQDEISSFSKCEDGACAVIGYGIGGFAYFRRDICTIYFPAFRGMPSYYLFTHEIRHCYQGSHEEWTDD